MTGVVPTIKIDYVPVDSPNRPGTESDMQWVTVHNTANPDSTAQDERDYVEWRTDNASFHYAVDDQEAIAIIPEEEVAWHAGDDEGNRTSIGVEICESGDEEKTYKHALGLIAKILQERGWGVDRVRTHESWSGKYCPRKLLEVWDEFLEDINATLESFNQEESSGGENVNSVPEWKLQGIKYLSERGLLNDVEGWTEKIDEPMPVWATTILLKKVHEDIVELTSSENK
ncbi:N-acetylmuramoyl-L-alanine amidase [Natronincola peptidivorans]|uniref:N-acetylmuramoyl-L-alanine amidase n=1 Tax=Natronincola peptidivorans TaxID=426128 RepID=A0A1I0H6N6_9FIRM|nr:N-acetylmuramoyl-L-alanine amidase [Natronincola peptidivorans]SET79411.1 N-acetylmuramoyl-L-alanine amidase [Natronincola peptidivorans]